MRSTGPTAPWGDDQSANGSKGNTTSGKRQVHRQTPAKAPFAEHGGNGAISKAPPMDSVDQLRSEIAAGMHIPNPPASTSAPNSHGGSRRNSVQQQQQPSNQSSDDPVYEAIRSALVALDTNHTGRVRDTQLRNVLRRFNLDVSNAVRLDNIISRCDSTQDGMVDYNELVSMLHNSNIHSKSVIGRQDKPASATSDATPTPSRAFPASRSSGELNRGGDRARDVQAPQKGNGPYVAPGTGASSPLADFQLRATSALTRNLMQLAPAQMGDLDSVEACVWRTLQDPNLYRALYP